MEQPTSWVGEQHHLQTITDPLQADRLSSSQTLPANARGLSRSLTKGSDGLGLGRDGVTKVNGYQQQGCINRAREQTTASPKLWTIEPALTHPRTALSRLDTPISQIKVYWLFIKPFDVGDVSSGQLPVANFTCKMLTLPDHRIIFMYGLFGPRPLQANSR